ncbi:MAG: hypothetical protein RLZZ67_645 [Candidatus Parcubacteria bacterium]|jgi:uncharacterized protein (TIGR01777 family)
MKVIIIGGSGFIGTKITEALLVRNYAVVVIDLNAPRVLDERVRFIKHNFATESATPEITEALNGAHGVINLAGASIGKRWSPAYKEVIYDSRIRTTRALVQVLAGLATKPGVLVNASAVGYYGDRKDEMLTEESTAGQDFLARLCVDWESAANEAQGAGIRVACIRTANVLGPGGLLASLEPIFKKGLGGYFGSGRQSMPWIHWKDIVGIYLFALENPVSGSYNVGAGKTVSQKELFTAFAYEIDAKFVWRIPYVFARIAFAEFADTLIASHNTDSTKLRQAGYVYQFSDIKTALMNM